MGDTIDQLKDRYPEASILIYNFGDKESSQVASSLSNYDVNVMDYPQQYKGFPLLPMEVIHHFLKTSESWLLLGQQHVLLMHCEQGGWPILAYMLAAFMTYNNNYSGQGRTLDVVYKQAARELLQFFPRLNPLPSQLRYLQYVSRNVGVKWPLQDKALTLKCVVFQFIPDFDGNGGCRPIFRIYGQDPLHPGDKTPKILFSTPKMNTDFGYYKQEELELINYDINCHVQGDIVLECINLYADLTSEKMMFRTMFNTAFMGSNFVVLNRDEIDTLWDAKDTFHNDFRAKLIFSDLDATAFKPLAELTCLYEWLGPKRDVILNVSHQIATPDIVQETSATGSSQSVQSINLYNVAPDLNKQKLSDVVKNKLQPKSALSPHSPSVLSSPPPPPPLLKGKILMKGGPTPPPPPPPPPPRPPTLKVMGHNLSTTQFSKNLGSTKLKAYHWSKLKKRVNGTLWAEAQNPGEALKVPEINMTELASLFSTSQPRAELKREYKGKIELRRAFNCEIILSKIRIPINELMESVLALDDSALDVVQVDNLIKICPTKEEMNIIMEYRGDRNELGKCEQFFMELMRVPRAESKLRVFSFKLQFNAQVSELWLRLNIINLSAKQIMSSAKLKAVMQTILSLGNALNQGTRRGDATGFRLESLLKLTDIRSNNHRTSLMHYLCKVLADKQPELLNFSKDLGSLVHASKLLAKSMADDMHAITTGLRNFMSEKRLAKKEGPVSKRLPKIQLKYLAEEMQAISKGLEKVSEELSMAENDGPVSEKFRKALKEFLCSAEGEVRSLASLYSVVGKNVDSLIRYFGEDPVRCPYEQVVSTLLKFVIMFNQANEENANQLKAEKKKAEWEASKQEKLKLIRIKSQDMSELECLFPASNTSAEQGDAKLKSRAAIANKPEKVLLIDHRRAYNCEVMLTKVKLPLNELMDYVLALEDSGLDPDQVNNFIKFCPTQEEMETLKGYKGEKDKLGKCEQFFLELMKVPRTESKLRVFSFKMKFNAQVSDLMKNLYIVNSLVEQTRSSGKLKRVMQTILSLGNALNQGTARGSAVGFRLDSLLKLTEIRGKNNRMTLMHYLCKVLADKLPEVLDFSKDLSSLEPAAKIQLKYLAEEMQAISQGLEKVSEELSMAENDGPVSENFRKALEEFLHSAEGEVRSLASLYSAVGKNVDSLILYFGEDPVRCPYEQVISTLLKFVRMFNQANE